jgi:molybdopterin/thiamine biosynthesis adenylyltransferase
MDMEICMTDSNQKRFVLVGAGGIGTWLAAGLVRLLEWKYPGSGMIIVDGDNYEAKNKERQDFTKFGNKAVVKATELSPQFPNTTIIPVAKWVVDDNFNGVADEESPKISASQLIREDDIVFAVVDNFAARKILFDAASKLNNIDVFTGGNDDGLFGSIYHYQKRNGIEITIHPSEFHPEYNNPPDKNPGELSCQERSEIEGGTQLLATNMAVASLILGRVQKTIVNNESPEETEIFFDLGIGKSEPYNRTHEYNNTPITV